MNNGVSKYRGKISFLNYWFLLLFIFWLPLKDDFLPTILALWIFTWLLEGNYKNRFKGFLQSKYHYLGFFLYFLLTLLFVPRANDFAYGIFTVQEKLSIVFFPIILLGSNQKVKSNTITILKIFILGNLIASVYCLTDAFLNSLLIENGRYVFNHNILPQSNGYSFFEAVNLRYSQFAYTVFSKFKHPSYFAMFIIFSIIIIVDFLRKGILTKRWLRALSIAIILFFIFILYLLQSRAAFITLGFILPLIPIIELMKKLKKRLIFLAIALIVSAITLISTSRKMKGNLSNLKTFLKSENKIELLKSDTRFQLWYTSVKVIEENFWWGTSPANLTDELVKKYNTLGFKSAYDDHLNSHNQYLESFAGLGIFGFLALMYIIVYTFIISIKKKHYLLFFLMVILSINFLFESMLNRMAGVLFMMFFISLFVFTKNDNENAELKDGLVENK